MSIVRLATGFSAGTVLLIASVTMLLSMMVGVNVAYQVESPENATVEYNGTHLIFANETSEVTPAPGESLSEWEPDEKPENDDAEEMPEELEQLDEELQAFELDIQVETVDNIGLYVMRSTFETTSVLGSYYADFFASNRDRIPEQIAQVYVWGYSIGLAGVYYHTVRRAAR